LEEAKAGQRVVFFVDAAHFVLGAYLVFLWCFERLFVKTGAGRQRFNVLSALNALTHELITVTNETYINALSVCELLHKLAALGLSILTSCTFTKEKPKSPKLRALRARNFGLLGFGVVQPGWA